MDILLSILSTVGIATCAWFYFIKSSPYGAADVPRALYSQVGRYIIYFIMIAGIIISIILYSRIHSSGFYILDLCAKIGIIVWIKIRWFSFQPIGKKINNKQEKLLESTQGHWNSYNIKCDGRFDQLSGKSQIIAIRNILNNCVVRDSQLIDISQEAENIVLGIPEAAVITLADGYYDYKINRPGLKDEEIYKILLKARKENLSSFNIKRIRSLSVFIGKILELHGVGEYLTKKQIGDLITKYRKYRNV